MSGILRKRDFAVVILVAVSICLCLFETPDLRYTLEPAWFVDNRSSFDKYPSADGPVNKPLVDYNLVKPIVTDLDGDFSKEVVLINSDLFLEIYNAEIPSNDKGEVYHPDATASVSLHGSHQTSPRRALPVAIRTGYIDEYEATTARQQVIVVVFDDWTVSCYDSTLSLMWEKVVGNKTHDLSFMTKYYKIHEVSIYISPLNLEGRNAAEDNGLIIVGASMTKRNFNATTAGVRLEEGLDSEEDGSVEHPEMEASAVLEHFNIFAVAGHSGKVLWRHDGVEVVAEQYSKSLPQHAYSLDMQDLMAHTHHAAGINHWSIFRQSLIDELPHQWSEPADTSMRIAHFVRRHFGANAAQQLRAKVRKEERQKNKKPVTGTKSHKDITSGKGRNGKQATHLAQAINLLQPVNDGVLREGASLPHTAAEHTLNPNVVVVHTSQGLEVIALSTGIPITSLALNQGVAYDDVDGDGVIDSVVVVDEADTGLLNKEVAHHFATAEGTAPSHCTMIVMSGLPIQSELFRGTICPERNSIHDSLSRNARHNGRRHSNRQKTNGDVAEELQKISYTKPLIVHKMDPDSLKESKSKDIVTAIHTGVVTSYSGSGDLNWMYRNGPTWSASDLHGHSAQLLDSDASRVEELGTHNSLYSTILLMGESSLQLLSREGSLLTHADIPQAPVCPPVLGDFDNDGVTDIVIVTSEAVLGYHLIVEQANYTIIIALGILSFIALLVFLGSIQSISFENDDEGTNISASINRRSKPMRNGGVFKIIRSTDETHID